MALKRKSIRLYFVRAATVPAAADSPRVDFEAGKWYDNVSPAHATAVGDAALPITHADCGHLLLEDGRAVVTTTRHVPDLDKVTLQQYLRPEVHVTIEPHACTEEE